VARKKQSSMKHRSGEKSLKTWQMYHMLLRNRETNFLGFSSTQPMMSLTTRDPSLTLVYSILNVNHAKTSLTKLINFLKDWSITHFHPSWSTKKDKKMCLNSEKPHKINLEASWTSK
jgi:hypothetical protein